MPKRKAGRTRKSKRATRKKGAARKKSARLRRVTRRKRSARKRTVRPRGRVSGAGEITLPIRPGFGPGSGGQSGDIEGLPSSATANSESVEELAEEGQNFEAEIIDAVEGARDPDEGEIETREVPENDVPEEYGNK